MMSCGYLSVSLQGCLPFYLQAWYDLGLSYTPLLKDSQVVPLALLQTIFYHSNRHRQNPSRPNISVSMIEGYFYNCIMSRICISEFQTVFICVHMCVFVYRIVCLLVYSFVFWCVCVRVMVFVCAVLIYTHFIVPLWVRLAPF